MLPFFIYWGVILACIAWLALSVYFSVFYLVRKENGNLWAFCFIQRDCRNCFSHYISRLSNMGLGNHPILKFDLSNISHLRCRCSFASDPRT